MAIAVASNIKEASNEELILIKSMTAINEVIFIPESGETINETMLLDWEHLGIFFCQNNSAFVNL